MNRYKFLRMSETVRYIRIYLLAAIIIVYSGSAAIAQTAKAQKNLTLLGVPSATVAPHGVVFGAVSWTDKRNSLSLIHI